MGTFVVSADETQPKRNTASAIRCGWAYVVGVGGLLLVQLLRLGQHALLKRRHVFHLHLCIGRRCGAPCLPASCPPHLFAKSAKDRVVDGVNLLLDALHTRLLGLHRPLQPPQLWHLALLVLQEGVVGTTKGLLWAVVRWQP